MSSVSIITPHFSLEEVTHSLYAGAHGIDNSLPQSLMDNILHTAEHMELVRAALDEQPIHINSWYRCEALNTALGSRPTSDHLKGNAVDFTCPSFGTPLQICRRLIAHQDSIGWKQLILEHTWVHISFDPIPNVVPKLQVLSLLNSGSYSVGLTDPYGKFYDTQSMA